MISSTKIPQAFFDEEFVKVDSCADGLCKRMIIKKLLDNRTRVSCRCNCGVKWNARVYEVFTGIRQIYYEDMVRPKSIIL